jgi:hypothetical protein
MLLDKVTNTTATNHTGTMRSVARARGNAFPAAFGHVAEGNSPAKFFHCLPLPPPPSWRVYTGDRHPHRNIDVMNEPRSAVVVVISAGLSAIPVVGGPIQTLFDAFEERVRHRAETTANEICEKAGGVGAVLSRIDENPELETLVTQAIEAATRTTMEAKRRLLARAAVAALNDDQKVEPAAMIVSTLSVLEPVHIHALARLAEAAKSSQQDESERSAVMRAASGAEAVPVLAALVQTGVVLTSTMIAQGDGTIIPAERSGHILIYDVTGFGYLLLAYLRTADEDSERLML